MELSKSVIDENAKRKESYFRNYDRIAGDPISETIPRQPLRLDGNTLYLPASMFELPFIRLLKEKGSFKKVLMDQLGEFSEEANSNAYKGFINARFQHDFEFWSFTCIKIQDKLTKQLVPFKLNRGQRKLLASFEKQRLKGKPIRGILVKARQWGGSTLTQMYMLWLQLFHYENWHSVIVSQFKAQSANIRNMITKVVRNYPRSANKPTLKTLPGTQNVKYIVQRGSEIHTGSAENPDAVRSFDVAMAHMSEVGLWASTQTKSGDDLVQALYASIPDVPGTFILMESTAKGIGTFFHEQWLGAVSGEVEMEPVFVAWYEIEMYTKPITNKERFCASMSDYNHWQWRQGASLEGINWYISYQKGKKYSDFQMRSEYPTTAEEAFQSNSGRYFTDDAIEEARRSIKQPIFIGDIRGDGLTGENSLKNIRIFEKDTGGEELLKIWAMPETNKEEVIENRYLVVVDIGGKSYKADNSVISVFDRVALMSPFGAMERVAMWKGHIDHDILAWKGAQIATYYDNALLVIESNTIDSRDKKKAESVLYEGDHFYTVIDELALEYDNLYARGVAPDTPVDKGKELKYGWHMNKKTKYQAYDRYTAALRDCEYIERSFEAVNEMQWLEIKLNGQIEATAGKRDDIQDTTATGVYIGLEEMPLPRIVNKNIIKRKTIRQGTSVGMASM